MDLYIDTVKQDDIREIADWGVLSGATTSNLQLFREPGNPDDTLRRICALADGPVSAEVVQDTTGGMVREARRLVALNDNIVVRLPMTAEGLRATGELSERGIKTNVSLVFSANQALLAARAGAEYISVLVGRLDDIGRDSSAILADIIEVFSINDFSTKVIAASIRHPMHVTQSALLGCDIATIPPDVFRWMLKHPISELGIERYKADWEKAKALMQEAASN